MKRVVMWMHERGQYDDDVMYVFESMEEARQFAKSMQGVLICTDTYTTENKNTAKAHIR